MAILLTAFDTYDQWQENSSWLALSEYLREHGAMPDVITRRYPVNLTEMKNRLENDLARGIAGVIHLGQRPGANNIQLEAICLNVAGLTHAAGRDFGSLIEGGPVAFRSDCPLGAWAEHLRRQQVPAEVSYHAGTYLCNAIMYLSHHWLQSRHLSIPVAFVHLPLANTQSAALEMPERSMELSTMARGVGALIDLMRRSVATASTA